jgi:hypothetical protein
MARIPAAERRAELVAAAVRMIAAHGVEGTTTPWARAGGERSVGHAALLLRLEGGTVRGGLRARRRRSIEKY